MTTQKSGVFSVLGGVAGLVGCSVIVAVLLAALVAPVVAVTDVGVEKTIGVFDDLPEYITLGTQSQQDRIYATRDGKPVQIATVYDQNRQVASWADISPLLKDAAVAGEDRRFYEHGGVDVASIARAAVGNLTQKTIVSGASTIDMQLVKNILVQQALRITDPKAQKKAYSAAISDTLDRKLKEMKLAIGLDKRYTKKEILLGYLNITGFGGQTYGVESASEEYFSVSAKDVTVAQAASLIAILQQPSLQNLGNPKYYAANKIRRDEILGDMLHEKDITQKQYAEAMATTIASEVKLTTPTSGCLYAQDAKFACDYVQRLVPTLTSLGATASARSAAWAQGGYRLYTSIDLNQQDVAQANLDKDAPATEARFKLGAAAVSVQPGTGRILLMAQNKGYNNSVAGAGPATTAVNFNTDKEYGGSSGFQTGSTYKIFTLADWLQNGHGLYDTVNGTSRSFPMSSFAAPCTSLVGAPYAPKNDSPGEGGSMSVLNATKNSVNAAFVTMAQKLNLCDIRADAMAMGVHRADGTPLVAYPSSVLGTNEIAPLSMAGAIATIGANGTYCAPTIVDKVVGPDGKDLPGQPQQCSQALAPNIASTEAFALAGVMTSGTGTAGNPKDGVPIVGKTGTNDGSSQNWLIATTTKVALAVWVGNIVGYQGLRKITVAGTNGYNTKFNIFRATMASLNTNPAYRGTAFPAPDPAFLHRLYVAPPTPVVPPTPGPQNGQNGALPSPPPKGPRTGSPGQGQGG